MTDFVIHFLLCNFFLCAITGIFVITKRLLTNHLTSRMQFNLWYMWAGILVVPFLPVNLLKFPQIFSWFEKLVNIVLPYHKELSQMATGTTLSQPITPLNDFALSVSRQTSSSAVLVLCIIWLIGILTVFIVMIKAHLRLRAIKKSALPLQNKEVLALYHDCLHELNIKRNIPLYSTAFLNSPIMAGLFRPCIYLPIRLLSEFHTIDSLHTSNLSHPYSSAQPSSAPDRNTFCPIRYMLLHELLHYKHKDNCANYLLELACVFYWFNPLVWYATKEMRSDREIACDTAVLELLNENEYETYGSALLDFAERLSFAPVPFSSGISGNMRQMKRRICNISAYQEPSARKIFKSFTVFMLIACTLLGLTPLLSANADSRNHYHWHTASENISIIDASAYFGAYKGSFVLYDEGHDKWHISNLNNATLRTAPESTYKIYTALFGLEENIISPENSFLAWNGAVHPFEAWNADQTLSSAMQSSVNWYFQEIDHRLGASALHRYVQEIGYGNKDLGTDPASQLTNATDADSTTASAYWMQSTLKISPVEQVMLLSDLHNNRLGFSPKNTKTVEDSIRLYSSEAGTLYGKTGTGRVEGKDINGWFIGYVETDGNTYFFATNIHSDTQAAGSKAAEITMNILYHMSMIDYTF